MTLEPQFLLDFYREAIEARPNNNARSAIKKQKYSARNKPFRALLNYAA